MQQKLFGKVIIVTGASSGIGETTAIEVAKNGASVILAARRIDRLKALAKQIKDDGGIAFPVETDLTDHKQIKNLVEITLSKYKRIDVLLNIAGWGSYSWFEELSRLELRNQFEVNVLGHAELTRLVIPTMKAQRSGHIINMSSYASRIAVPPMTVYASTKYAIEGLSDGLRRELSAWGIHVTRIHPSGVPGTEFNAKASARGGVKFRSSPIGRVSKERIARLIVHLILHPRRSVFVSRLYDIPVFLNRRFPGLVDLFFKYWVGYKRKEEISS